LKRSEPKHHLTEIEVSKQAVQQTDIDRILEGIEQNEHDFSMQE